LANFDFSADICSLLAQHFKVSKLNSAILIQLIFVRKNLKSFKNVQKLNFFKLKMALSSNPNFSTLFQKKSIGF